MFQLNISNSLGTTMAAMARGASNNEDWFVGFNVSRKFFSRQTLESAKRKIQPLLPRH